MQQYIAEIWIWRLLLRPLLLLRSPETYLLPSFLAFVGSPCLGSWLGWVVSARDDRHFDVVSQGGKRLDDQTTDVAGGPTVSPSDHTTTSQGDHQDQQNSTCKRNHKCLAERPLLRIWKLNGHCSTSTSRLLSDLHLGGLLGEDGKQRGESKVCGQLGPTMEELTPSSKQSSQVVTFWGQERSWDIIWWPHRMSRALADSGGTV